MSHSAWFETLVQIAFCVMVGRLVFWDIRAVVVLREGLIFIYGGVCLKKNQNFCKKVGIFGE